ncbi:MAG: hypothetical protein ABEH83_07920 [Halobacterium sp.]
MTRWSRRAFLAGGATGIAALAGCSDLPIVGSGGQSASFDGEALRERAVEWSFEEPSAYPAPVPERLGRAHRERARALLDEVSADVSFPNEAVTRRLRDQRDSATESLSGVEAASGTLEWLDDWRYRRGRAAEVRAAYAAAAGEADAGALRERRAAVRRDLTGFESSWTYRGGSPVEAFAVHRELESLTGACHRYLVSDRSFPDGPRAAVFAVGELARDVERARASIADASGLRDAFVDDGMDAYWSDVATAARRLERAMVPTQRPVEPYVRRDAEPSDFKRDVEGTPAEHVFTETRRVVFGARREAERSRQWGSYASAAAAAGRALLGLVAMDSVVEAIQGGKHGVPSDVDAVIDRRNAAASAVRDALAVGPVLVSRVVGMPAWQAVAQGDGALGGRPERDSREGPPDTGEVVRAVGHYAAAEHLATAVPAVVERVTTELRADD